MTDEYPVKATWFFPVGNCSDAIDTSSLSQFFNELFVLEYDLPFLHWDVNTDDSFLDVHNCQSMVVHLEYNFKERGLFQVEARCALQGCHACAQCAPGALGPRKKSITRPSGQWAVLLFANSVTLTVGPGS